MRAPWLLPLALAAFAGPPPADPVAAFKDALADARAKEAKFLDDFHGKFSAAAAAFEVPWGRAHAEPDYPQDATWDFPPMLAIYAEFVAIEDLRAKAAEALSASGAEGATAALFEELLDLAKRTDEVDAAMEKAMPPLSRFMCNLQPGVVRHGLGRYEQRLLPALVKAPGAVAYLARDGWKRAQEMDGRTSIVRRVAVLEALGLDGGAEAREFLGKRLAAKGSTVRIAAMEALFRCGPEAVPALLPLLADPCPVVRFALLQEISAAKPDPRWIRPVFAALGPAKGRMRAEHLAALRVLTRQEFGDAPDRWKAWIEANAAAIDGGTFDAAKAPVEKVEAAAAPAPVFYGLPTESRAVIFLVFGTFTLHAPADLEVQRTRNSAKWPQRPKGHWDDPPVIHHAVILHQIDRALAALPAGSTFGLLGMYGKNEAVPCGDGMARPSPKSVAAAHEFVEKLGLPGWCGPYEGLREAMRMARLDPSPAADDFPDPVADTVFLHHSGGPEGGRFVGAEPTVEAILRLNRFRRLRVDGVRISNGKEEGERTMKWIAEGTGGTYLFCPVPPK